jgi:pSer/pThr/pTyr-binding forkhead associated (FHA) protein
MSTADSEFPPATDSSVPGSLFDSFDGWAQLLRQTPPPEQPPDATPPLPAGMRRAPPDAFPFRPLRRPPMALLRIIDDGREDGETVRLRGAGVDIGRSAGAVTIPHDEAIAPLHARIVLLADGTWQLTDLGTRTGTFVRVTEARLRHGGSLLIGGTHLTFERGPGTDSAAFVEIPGDDSRGAPPKRHICSAAACTIGGHGGGASIVLDDPFVSPLHAEVFRGEQGWRVINRGRNGLWMRIERPVRLAAAAQFQCGEQRFVFVPLPG